MIGMSADNDFDDSLQTAVPRKISKYPGLSTLHNPYSKIGKIPCNCGVHSPIGYFMPHTLQVLAKLSPLFDKRIDGHQIIRIIFRFVINDSIVAETVVGKLAWGWDGVRAFRLGLGFASSSAPFPFIGRIFL